MPQGTTDGSGLGFFEDNGGDPFPEPEAPEEVTDEPSSEVPEEPDATEEVAAEEEVKPDSVPEAEPGPVADASEETGSAEAEQPESAPEEAPKYAEFESVEALEQGYREAVAWNTRMAQAQSEDRRKVEELEAVIAQLVYDTNQRRASEDPEFAERWEAMQANQQLVDQQVSAQIDPLRQQLEIQQRQAELQAVVGQFLTKHEVAPGSAKDIELDRIVKNMDFDIGDPNALELAYAMSEDLNLRKVLTANKHWSETNEGLELAQAEAARLAAVAAPATTTTAPAPPPEVPHVETGSSGAPSAGAPGDRPKDAFDEALDLAKQEKESIFY